MPSVIEVDHLNFSFGSGALTQSVLKNVTISIEEGEIVLITGPSGSGKTTFLTIIGGLRQAFHGSVKVLGHQFVNGNEQIKVKTRQQIGYIRPLHNRKNFAVVTEKIFQVTLVARHFNRKWSFFLFLGEFSPLCNIWTDRSP
ncbi:ATP-binding cassette domain-containing protein, partial [Nitrosomonas ureae]